MAFPAVLAEMSVLSEGQTASLRLEDFSWPWTFLSILGWICPLSLWDFIFKRQSVLPIPREFTESEFLQDSRELVQASLLSHC